MTRDDQIRATVAAGMQDSTAIFEVLEECAMRSWSMGDNCPVLSDIAHEVSEACMDGVSQAHREALAIRLLNSLERYARAALTAKADDDLPQPDDEENDDA